MREVRSTTDQSVEGLYGETVRHTSLKDKTVLGALRSRYPYEGKDCKLRTNTACLLLVFSWLRWRAARVLPFAGFLQTCGILLAMLTIYGALLAAIGKDARLPGPVWAVPLIWICAQAAGFVAAKVHCKAILPCSSLLPYNINKHVVNQLDYQRAGCSGGAAAYSGHGRNGPVAS